jgi:hypothetical protein
MTGDLAFARDPGGAMMFGFVRSLTVFAALIGSTAAPTLALAPADKSEAKLPKSTQSIVRAVRGGL